MDVQKAIKAINSQIDKVQDPVAKVIIAQLLDIIEYLMQENKELKAENQRLRVSSPKLWVNCKPGNYSCCVPLVKVNE
jgi:hypothetical protein